jgi:lipid II:glycine glycyltransferase (peptidoglycan interpeptide bridge formation enzyme)
MEITKGTYIIDLIKSEEELMTSFDKDTRYCIRKGQKEHIPTTLYNNVYVIHLQDKQYKPSSMLVFGITGDTATLLATNTDSALKNLQGNSLAYWEMIRVAKEYGATKLDLGGVELEGPTQSQERINKFKEGFGGTLITHKQNVSVLDGFKAKFKKFIKK